MSGHCSLSVAGGDVVKKGVRAMAAVYVVLSADARCADDYSTKAWFHVNLCDVEISCPCDTIWNAVDSVRGRDHHNLQSKGWRGENHDVC